MPTDSTLPHYDAIIVLGSKPDTTTWRFPAHVYATLDRAADLYRAGVAPFIILSGKWALSFDSQGITQPYRECDEMATYLAAHGVPADALLLEGESKDTISNLFYIKRQILAPRALRRALLITADFREQRIQYLAAKILGPAYTVAYHTVPSAPQERYPHEDETMRRTQQFLGDMPAGEDGFLDGTFYTAPYYL